MSGAYDGRGTADGAGAAADTVMVPSPPTALTCVTCGSGRWGGNAIEWSERAGSTWGFGEVSGLMVRVVYMTMTKCEVSLLGVGGGGCDG